LIERQMSIVRARAAARPGEEGDIETVFDLACGHGLLGVMLAHRFQDLRVVCVDLERRPGFDSFVSCFRDAAGLEEREGNEEGVHDDAATKSSTTTATPGMLEFVVGDIAEVR